MTATRTRPGTDPRRASRSAEPRPSRSAESVAERARPSAGRAAAAARLAGASAREKDVTERLLVADRRRRRAEASGAKGAAGRPGPLRAAIGESIAAPRPSRRPQEEERRHHLRVVERAPRRSPIQRQRRARLVLGASIVAGSFICMALVYLHVVLAQRQFSLDKLQSQVQAAQTNYQNLRLQVDQLSSPQHVITVAEGQLGMVQPNSVTYLPQASGVSKATSGVSKAASGSSSLVDPGTGHLVQPAAAAPSGAADWPTIKASLQGAP